MKRLITIFCLFFWLFGNGQTTFYLEASGTHYGSNGTFSDWTSSGSSIKVPCFKSGFKQKTTIASTTIAVNNSSSTATTCFAQYISPALLPQTISGTVTGYARMSLSSTSGCTAQSRVKITVIDRSGAVVATLLSMTSGASNLTTTLTSYQILNAAALTSYTCTWGDRICIEIGIGRSAGTTARNGTISFGSSSATDISAAGSTTANNPVIIFSNTISFYQGFGIVASSSFTGSWDIASASSDSKSYDPSAQVSGDEEYSVLIKNSGTTVILNRRADVAYEYTLSTPYDISTASYVGASADISGDNLTQVSFPFGTETVFYGSTYTRHIIKYSLSGGVSTITQLYNKNINADIANILTGIAVSSDSSKVYVLASTGTIYQYTMSNPGDLSTLTSDSKSFNMDGIVSDDYYGLFLAPDNKTLYISGAHGIIYEMKMGTIGDITTLSEINSKNGFPGASSIFITSTDKIYNVPVYSGNPVITQYSITRH